MSSELPQNVRSTVPTPTTEIQKDVTVLQTTETNTENTGTQPTRSDANVEASFGTARNTGSSATELEAIITANGRTWIETSVKFPLNGPVQFKEWAVMCPEGHLIYEGHGPENMRPIDCFMNMFSRSHLIYIIEATNCSLSSKSKQRTSVGEVLRFLECLFS